MNPFRAFTRPEYAFRFRQVFTRVHRAFTPLPASAVVKLPWGDVLRVCPRETIGSEIWHHGIFDLTVAEILWRLLGAGELAVDVGANVGQMTSLLRRKAGPAGQVWAFEPHPELFSALEFLRDAPQNQRPGARLELVRAGLSEAPGAAWLDPGRDWETNRGLGRVSENAEATGRTFAIELKTLDESLPPSAQVGVVKVDVEGHELAVLRGARRLLERRAVRDWVYEDFCAAPSPVAELLRAHGYEIFVLQSRWGGPGLRAVAQAAEPVDLAHNFLATRDAVRAKTRLAQSGWQVLTSAHE